MKKLSLAAAFAISTIVAQDVPPELPSLKRVYVDRLVGNETADRIRDGRRLIELQPYVNVFRDGILKSRQCSLDGVNNRKGGRI